MVGIYKIISPTKRIVYWENVFTGSLSDCEAYIRLYEKGYM
jgi:hypothetical protein